MKTNETDRPPNRNIGVITMGRYRGCFVVETPEKTFARSTEIEADLMAVPISLRRRLNTPRAPIVTRIALHPGSVAWVGHA